MRSHLSLSQRSRPLCFAVARIFKAMYASAVTEGHPPKSRYSLHLVNRGTNRKKTAVTSAVLALLMGKLP